MKSTRKIMDYMFAAAVVAGCLILILAAYLTWWAATELL